MMMKALQIASPAAHPAAIASTLQLVSIPRPTAQPGHVEHMQNAAIGTNFIDAVFAMGHFPGRQYPLVLGIEGAKYHRQVGANVSGLQIGDRVA
ncbi:hypothetical protein BCR44DRAFT_71826 [Catenaria anguillulae PL171]|uniref:Alcohol dehydrogenase-like N-terminal domain-containing protein n=1 Tax=Catenaria anguillulae PL171 TaxID=765915 RepID=A0A1Y2I451_9FUNG|nr:hypothetical protein BCR44DRAFT_71826 [Catenaria anguillulae PL171]